MLSKAQISQQLKHVICETHFDQLGEKYQGKVRDCYTAGARRFLITSDRLSCFDRVVTTVPFKGRVLNQLAISWFEKSKDIIANHIIDVPDPSVIVAKNVQILPIEVVVRDYIAGSAWRDYQAGKSISGIVLPPGLKQYQKLPQTMLTPSTKAPKGDHDLPISEQEIVSSGKVEKRLWQQVREIALLLFGLGREHLKRRGLILVDTKYEFGLLDGKLILADEIHTLDSSRFWIEDDYNLAFAAGRAPKMLDKEPFRQWLLSQGYKGEGEIPHFSDEYRVEIAQHYISAYEKITGSEFDAEVGDVSARILRNLKAKGYL